MFAPVAAQEAGRTVVWTTARQTVSEVGEGGRWGDAGWCSEASRGWDSQAQQQLLSMAVTMGRTSEQPNASVPAIKWLEEV